MPVMVDAVRLYTGVDDPASVAARLDRPEVRTRADGLPRVYGHVGPLRASLVADTLRLRGSLPGLIGRTSPLSRVEVGEVRGLLEDRLGLDLEAARLTGLEIAADLLPRRSVAQYLPLLARRSRLQRVTFEGESVSFVGGSRSLVFYDKVAEVEDKAKRAERAARRRHQPPPPRLRLPGPRVLRYEVQLQQKLRSQMREAGPVTLGRLHDRAFWERLVALWLGEYRTVEKIRVPLAPRGLDVRREAALAGALAVGCESFEAAIQACKESGELPKRTGDSHLQWLRRLVADAALTCEDDRVTELDALVEAAAAHALAA